MILGAASPMILLGLPLWLLLLLFPLRLRIVVQLLSFENGSWTCFQSSDLKKQMILKHGSYRMLLVSKIDMWRLWPLLRMLRRICFCSNHLCGSSRSHRRSTTLQGSPFYCAWQVVQLRRIPSSKSPHSREGICCVYACHCKTPQAAMQYLYFYGGVHT